MKLAYITIAALVSLSEFGSNASNSSISPEELEFLNAAYSRLAADYADQQRADEQHLKELRKEEAWAKNALADASMNRRAAAEDVAKQTSVYGQGSKQSNSSAKQAAEARLDKAEDKEAKARAEFQRRDNERRNAEKMVKESAEVRRLAHVELSQLRQQFNQNPTRELYETMQARFQAAAAEHGIYCNVTWKTSPKPAAVIVYQTKRSRERGEKGVSLRDVTETKEAVLMGIYHVWAMRGGRPTSDPDRLVAITQKDVVVTIVEDR